MKLLSSETVRISLWLQLRWGMQTLAPGGNRMTFKLVFFAAWPLLLTAAPAYAVDVNELDFDKQKLPATLKIRGDVVDGARWLDKFGENLLVLTQTGAFPSKTKDSNDGRDAELYGYHFVSKAGKWAQLWKIRDFERNCPFDLYVGHVPRSVTVTDLDSDGVAETAFLYKLTCRSDVSPSRLKLIMHEGETKYAIRGRTTFPKEWKMDVSQDMKPDPAFAKAPASFKQYAIKRWNQFVVEGSFEQF